MQTLVHETTAPALNLESPDSRFLPAVMQKPRETNVQRDALSAFLTALAEKIARLNADVVEEPKTSTPAPRAQVHRRPRQFFD